MAEMLTGNPDMYSTQPEPNTCKADSNEIRPHGSRSAFLTDADKCKCEPMLQNAHYVVHNILFILDSVFLNNTFFQWLISFLFAHEQTAFLPAPCASPSFQPPDLPENRGELPLVLPSQTSVATHLLCRHLLNTCTSF